MKMPPPIAFNHYKKIEVEQDSQGKYGSKCPNPECRGHFGVKTTEFSAEGGGADNLPLLRTNRRRIGIPASGNTRSVLEESSHHASVKWAA